MDISTKPYPINLVNTKENAKAHRKYKLKMKRFLEKEKPAGDEVIKPKTGEINEQKNKYYWQENDCSSKCGRRSCRNCRRV